MHLSYTLDRWKMTPLNMNLLFFESGSSFSPRAHSLIAHLWLSMPYVLRILINYFCFFSPQRWKNIYVCVYISVYSTCYKYIYIFSMLFTEEDKNSCKAWWFLVKTQQLLSNFNILWSSSVGFSKHDFSNNWIL